LPITLSSW